MTIISIRKSGEAWAVKVQLQTELMRHVGLELGPFRFDQAETEFGIWGGDPASHERFHMFLIDAARKGLEPKWSAPALRSYRKDREDQGLDAGGMGQAGLIKIYLDRAKQERRCA